VFPAVVGFLFGVAKAGGESEQLGSARPAAFSESLREAGGQLRRRWPSASQEGGELLAVDVRGQSLGVVSQPLPAQGNGEGCVVLLKLAE
jgi:hypothetical protein